MKILFAAILVVMALPAMSQTRPPNYPYPPFPPYRPEPLPDLCQFERYDRALAATEAAAINKLDRFAAEKGVTCTLTQSEIYTARGRCVSANEELFAVLKMSFNVNCLTRDVTSVLRKTTIRYY